MQYRSWNITGWAAENTIRRYKVSDLGIHDRLIRRFGIPFYLIQVTTSVRWVCGLNQWLNNAIYLTGNMYGIDIFTYIQIIMRHILRMKERKTNLYQQSTKCGHQIRNVFFTICFVIKISVNVFCSTRVYFAYYKIYKIMLYNVYHI